MTVKDQCDVIARGFQARGIAVRNQRTGRTIPNSDGVYDWRDVWEWDSHGELMHLPIWYAFVTDTAPEDET